MKYLSDSELKINFGRRVIPIIHIVPSKLIKKYV